MAALAAALFAALAGAATAAPGSAATVAHPELSGAARTTASCAAESGHLLVDIQVDRSGSLAVTDPQDRRVDGISAALIGLARLTEKRGGTPPLRVDVLLSSFAGTVEPAEPGAADWRRLDDDSLDGLLRDAARYADRDDARDTDYVLALAAARDALNARAEQVAADDADASPCKVVLFLSDGSYRLRDRTDATSLPSTVKYAPGVRLDRSGGGARAVAAGREHLCRPGGLMDRVAHDEIVAFTVALSGSAKFTAADRAFLESLTTGTAAGERCGRLLSPATGEFFDVRDNVDLFLTFSNLLDPEVDPDEPRVCAESEPLCREGVSSFDAPPGLRGFVLSAAAPLPGIDLALTDPSGETTLLTSDGERRLELAGTTVDQRWIRSRALDVDAQFDRASDAWHGRWRYAFVAPAGADLPSPRVTLRLQSGLRPRLAGEPELVEGATAEFDVELVDEDDRAAPAGALARSARLRATAVDSEDEEHDVEVERTGDGTFTAKLDVPKGAAGGPWRLDAEATFAGAGAPVDPRLAVLPLGTPTEPDFPWWLLAVFAAALALLGAIALLTVQRARRAAARFTPPQQLLVAACDVTVTPGGEPRLDPLPSVVEQRFEPLSREGRDAPARGLSHEGFVLKVRARRPFARPRGEATAPGRQLVGGGLDGPLRGHAGHRASEAPFALSGTWLFSVARIDGDGDVHGRLLAFSSEDERIDHGRRVLDAAIAALRGQDWDGFDAADGTGGTGGDDGPDLGSSLADDLFASLDPDDDGAASGPAGWTHRTR